MTYDACLPLVSEATMLLLCCETPVPHSLWGVQQVLSVALLALQRIAVPSMADDSNEECVPANILVRHFIALWVGNAVMDALLQAVSEVFF